MDLYFLTLINGEGPLCTIQRLKARYDEALSNVAFNFHLRRYTKAERAAASVAKGKKGKMLSAADRPAAAGPTLVVVPTSALVQWEEVGAISTRPQTLNPKP
jgi:hypothetical protein